MAIITAVAHYIPNLVEENLQKQKKFGVNQDFIMNKLGVKQVSRMLAGEDTSDMCVKAYDALPKHERPNKIDCIVVCTQNPDGAGIPHTSAIIHNKLNLSEQCACFDISLGCSGYVYSLSVLKSFMESNDFNSGLLFTADPYSKIINPDDKNTVMLFGDAATVTVMQKDSAKNKGFSLKNFVFHTRGKDWKALHNNEGTLVMNGRAIFNFALTNVPMQIKMLMETSNIKITDVDAFLFHQGSKLIVEKITKRIDVDEKKVPVMLEKYGNTVSSSIPLILESIIKEKDKEIIVMSGFGVGLSWASCVAKWKKML